MHLSSSYIVLPLLSMLTSTIALQAGFELASRSIDRQKYAENHAHTGQLVRRAPSVNNLMSAEDARRWEDHERSCADGARHCAQDYGQKATTWMGRAVLMHANNKSRLPSIRASETYRGALVFKQAQNQALEYARNHDERAHMASRRAPELLPRVGANDHEKFIKSNNQAVKLLTTGARRAGYAKRHKKLRSDAIGFAAVNVVQAAKSRQEGNMEQAAVADQRAKEAAVKMLSDTHGPKLPRARKMRKGEIQRAAP